MGQLKDYVTGGQARTVAEGTVLLDVTHNLLARRMVEIPFNLYSTVSVAKEKVYQISGSKPEHMTLLLNGATPLDDTKLLGDYNVATGMLLHCVDDDPFSTAKGGALEDVSLVDKYVMSDEDYDKRENTYRAYKKKMLEKDPNWVPVHVAKARAAAAGEKKLPQAPAEDPAETLSRVKLGLRCSVFPGDRRGTVMFVGEVPEIPEPEVKDEKGETVPTPKRLWVGINYDDPVGKHDGVMKCKRYFTCPNKHGAFVAPSFVKVGDFPELDPFASDNEEEENDSAQDQNLLEEL